MSEKRWAYEDFEEGMSIDLGTKLVTAEEIIEFASEFDAQPMHLDEQAGKESILGGLSASGWHTCCMFMRMISDAFILDSTSQGAPGIDHAKWRKPVLAGDRLTGHSMVVAKRPSQSRPKLGLILWRHELFNQNGETVLELQNSIMFLRREAA